MGKEGVINLANNLVKKLKPFCKKIEVAGSIRRGDKNPKDIDIVLIPKDVSKIKEFMETMGRFLQGGEHESTWRVERVNVELYYTNEKEWGAELLAYSSTKGSAIGLRMVAKRMGLKLSQHGLFKRGKRIAGKTEKEIYSKLGRKYKLPENR